MKEEDRPTRREFLKKGAALLIYVPPAVATFMVSLQGTAWGEAPPCKVPTQCQPPGHSFYDMAPEPPI